MNQGFVYRERIGPGADGQGLLGYLVHCYRHSDEAVWRARLDRGELDLDAVVARPGDVLRAGQRLVWRRPPWEEPDVPLAWAVLHRDDHLLAVAKPRGLPTVPNGGFLTHTLLHRVRLAHPAAVPVHRLGRGTSGLVLFALTPLARAGLSAAWRAGRVEKIYRALASGVPERAAFTIDTPIGPVPHPRLGQVHASSPAGKPAVSHVRVLEPRGNASLLEVAIETGRPHQIRIHLAWAGHPLVGDPLYGPGGLPLGDPALPGDPGYRLHAHRLSLEHPATGARVTFECAPPAVLVGRIQERGA
jgi:23S rRNA pseudouridine1911/1915/1917 synthase